MAGRPGRDQVKAMERLVRIMAVLNEAGSVGATTEKLFAVAEYGGDNTADQLSVDFRHLRKQGWQIDNVAGPGEDGRYRMVAGDNRLRLRLSPAQLAALQRAVILSRRVDLAKSLGIKPGSLPKGVGSEVVPQQESTELSLALQAVRLRSRIRFSYKGTRRVLHPGTVRFQNYQWYLSGIEDGDDQVKHFAVSRMSAASLEKPGTAQLVPEVRRIPLHPLRWDVDPPVEVTLRTAPDYVLDVERWLMAPQSKSEHDGIVDLTYSVTNRQAFRARIYVLGPRVTVAGPDEVRDEIIAELHRLGA
jgi:predicted DNA-binding transcriptional regulator YafY